MAVEWDGEGLQLLGYRLPDAGMNCFNKKDKRDAYLELVAMMQVMDNTAQKRLDAYLNQKYEGLNQPSEKEAKRSVMGKYVVGRQPMRSQFGKYKPVALKV